MDPTASITASAEAVERGFSVELRWSTRDAVSAEIDQGIGAVPLEGSLRLTPLVSTTWRLTATGAHGTNPATASVTVAVNPRPSFRGVSLLPLNASPFERALELAPDRDIDIPLRKLWSSADCPLDLLAYLAWALRVEEWDPDWPEAVKRTVVRDAWLIHREKGTLAGLKRLLENAGAEYEYEERPEGVPMTALLKIFNSNAVFLPDIAPAIDRVKRLSLDLDIELHSAVAGQIAIAGGLGASTLVEISDWSGYAE